MLRRLYISIHAPRAGSDVYAPILTRRSADFNPRSPCGERPACLISGASRFDFNPRSPCGERRPHPPAPGRAPAFQSTLPVRGATEDEQPGQLPWDISIHAPRAGSDCGRRSTTPAGTIFQSTLPVRGATRHFGRRYYRGMDFNPRSPCGERLGARPCLCG